MIIRTFAMNALLEQNLWTVELGYYVTDVVKHTRTDVAVTGQQPPLVVQEGLQRRVECDGLSDDVCLDKRFKREGYVRFLPQRVWTDSDVGNLTQVCLVPAVDELETV